MTRIVAWVERSETRERPLSRTRLPRISLRSIRATCCTNAFDRWSHAYLTRAQPGGTLTIRVRIFFAKIRTPRAVARIGGTQISPAKSTLNRSRFFSRFCFATFAASCSRKGRQPVTPTDGVGAVPAGGGSSLPLSGGPGTDPAGIITGARGASLKRGAKVRVTPAHCIA